MDRLRRIYTNLYAFAGRHMDKQEFVAVVVFVALLVLIVVI